MPIDGPLALLDILGPERQKLMMPIAGASEFFRLDVSMTRDVPTVRVIGEVGLAESDDFVRDLVQAVSQMKGTRRIIDLRELVYIDGKGLTALWESLANWRTQGVRIAIIAGSAVRQMLAWLQMEQLGSIVSTEDELGPWLDSSP